MGSSKLSEYLFEEFTLDKSHLKKLKELQNNAFGNEAKPQSPAICNSFETLHTYLLSPPRDEFSYVRAIHKKTKDWVGFIAAIPRKLVIQDKNKEYKIFIPGFLAVDKKHQKKGIATQLGKILVSISLKKGYQASLPMFEVGAHGIDAGDSIARDVERGILPILKIKKGIIRVLDVDKLSKVMTFNSLEKIALRLLEGIKYQNKLPKDIKTYDSIKYSLNFQDHLLEIENLLNDFCEKNQVSFKRDINEFKWMLSQPNVISVFHISDEGKIDGFIVVHLIFLKGVNGQEIEVGNIDTIHLYNLSFRKSGKLISGMDYLLENRDVCMLTSSKFPYFNPRKFYLKKYVNFSYPLIVSFHFLTDIPIPEKIDSFYLEHR